MIRQEASQFTREWWDNVLCQAAQLRLAEVTNFQLLEIVPEVVNLSEVYFSSLQIPEKARIDASERD